jgi:hypothetical protein
MTSEERNEMNRVKKRLAKAINLRNSVALAYIDLYEGPKCNELMHKWQVLCQRITRMKATLAGYEKG